MKIDRPEAIQHRTAQKSKEEKKRMNDECGMMNE
jgi:hypothetical protein